MECAGRRCLGPGDGTGQSPVDVAPREQCEGGVGRAVEQRWSCGDCVRISGRDRRRRVRREHNVARVSIDSKHSALRRDEHVCLSNPGHQRARRRGMEQHADGAGVGAGHGGVARRIGSEQRLRFGQLPGHGCVGSSDAWGSGHELRRAAVLGQLRVDQYVLEHGNHHDSGQRDVMVAGVRRGGHVLLPSSGHKRAGSEPLGLRAGEPLRADRGVGDRGPGAGSGHGSLQRSCGVRRDRTRRAALHRVGLPVVMHGLRELERHRPERGVPTDRHIPVFGGIVLMRGRGVVRDSDDLRRRCRPRFGVESDGRREWRGDTIRPSEPDRSDRDERRQRQPHVADTPRLEWLVDRPLRGAPLRHRRRDLRCVVLRRAGGRVHRRRMWRVRSVHLRSSRGHRRRPRQRVGTGVCLRCRPSTSADLPDRGKRRQHRCGGYRLDRTPCGRGDRRLRVPPFSRWCPRHGTVGRDRFDRDQSR